MRTLGGGQGVPIYEFKCQDCDRLTSIFVRTPSAEYEAVCRHCGSRKLTRRHLRLRLSQVRADDPRRSTALSPSGSKTTATLARSAAGSSEVRGDGRGDPEQTRKMIDAAREGESRSR